MVKIPIYRTYRKRPSIDEILYGKTVTEVNYIEPTREELNQVRMAMLTGDWEFSKDKNYLKYGSVIEKALRSGGQ